MASSTLLQIAQQFSRRNSLPVPSALIGSTDARVLQVQQLIEDVALDIWRRSDWRVCIRRVEWTSAASEDQGLLTVRCPEDFDHVIPRTFWDNTLRRPVFGPVSDMVWQQLKAFVPGSPLYQFMIREGAILVYPAMTAGDTLSLAYKTQRKWQATGGGAYKVLATVDTDVSVFPDNLIELGLDYLWKETKGKAGAAKAEEKYEEALLIMAGSDSVQPVIHTDFPDQNLLPGIWVPQGNWLVT